MGLSLLHILAIQQLNHIGLQKPFQIAQFNTAGNYPGNTRIHRQPQHSQIEGSGHYKNSPRGNSLGTLESIARLPHRQNARNLITSADSTSYQRGLTLNNDSSTT